jgi:hypothetical protein
MEATEAEWLADLAERETIREKYAHSIGCYLAAPKMRRQATTIRLAVKFKIGSGGTVPFTFAIHPVYSMPLYSFACRPNAFSKGLLNALIVYALAKILRAAKQNGGISAFAGELKNYKSWDYELKVQRKGLELDFSNVLKAYAINPSYGREVLQKYVNILSVGAEISNALHSKSAVLPNSSCAD